MGEFVCYLLQLLQPQVGECEPSILRVALKLRRDQALKIRDSRGFQPYLPLHCQGYTVLEVQQIFELVDQTGMSRGFSRMQRLLIQTILERADLPQDDQNLRCFYNIEEWRARGEEHGLDSLLIVQYDGHPLSRYFNSDKEAYQAMEQMSEALAALGYGSEECTGAYSAIYRKDT